MTRDQMIDALWMRSKLFVEREEFAKTFKGWEMAAVEVDGTPAFVTVTRGAEFHFESLDGSIPITRQMIREFLKPIISAYGYAMTRTPKDDRRQQRFNEAFGFRATAVDTEYLTYCIRQVN